MNKIIKITTTMLFLIMIIVNLSCNSFAANSLSEILEQGKDFIEGGELIYKHDNIINETTLKQTSKSIVNILTALGIVVALVIGVVIGIKIITGTVEEKAKIKEALIPYIVGCVIVFGGFTIWSNVINMGNAMENVIVGNPSEEQKNLYKIYELLDELDELLNKKTKEEKQEIQKEIEDEMSKLKTNKEKVEFLNQEVEKYK